MLHEGLRLMTVIVVFHTYHAVSEVVETPNVPFSWLQAPSTIEGRVQNSGRARGATTGV
jgi:hypothetical protein